MGRDTGQRHRARARARGRDMGHGSSLTGGCHIPQVSEHPQLRGKSTGARSTPIFIPHSQRKAKTRPYFKYPNSEDHLSTNFLNLVSTVPATTDT